MGSLLPSSHSVSKQSRVFLNVYDLTPLNNYLYWLGVGIHHSGIEVHGVEYAFGAHACESSGVFEVEPKSCPGFVFRRSVLLGTTDLSPSEFRDFIDRVASSYHGTSYNLMEKNCNHFTDDISKQLTGKHIPGWVNRLARIGSICSCLLPESIEYTAVHPAAEYDGYSGGQSPGCYLKLYNLKNALSFRSIFQICSSIFLMQMRTQTQILVTSKQTAMESKITFCSLQMEIQKTIYMKRP
eukprot:TRINITY_DN8446_c0_g1_i4.p1 TRINITY_DN8446_c0_g1~~TRINITY_DN8446_c0_g1_i4.p1  ORF type:complete len:240 (+),score=21.47 TRINITY_DN8446_c0_g1_i4:319-1038(+)